ncbi:MAG: hypothetical protein WC381_10750 [Kiritimatiellia bacterium]|jgi:hypothetical protein
MAWNLKFDVRRCIGGDGFILRIVHEQGDDVIRFILPLDKRQAEDLHRKLGEALHQPAAQEPVLRFDVRVQPLLTYAVDFAGEVRDPEMIVGRVVNFSDLYLDMTKAALTNVQRPPAKFHMKQAVSKGACLGHVQDRHWRGWNSVSPTALLDSPEGWYYRVKIKGQSVHPWWAESDIEAVRDAD